MLLSPEINQSTEGQPLSVLSLISSHSQKLTYDTDAQKNLRRPRFRGASGQQAKYNKLRAILNKLTEENIVKLGAQIVADFTFEQDLVRKFVDLVFEKATQTNRFTQAMAELCSYLKAEFLCKAEQGSLFGQSIQDKVTASIDEGYSDQFCCRIRFYGLLLHYQVIEQENILQCLDVLLQAENLCDHSVEEACHMFKAHGILLDNDRLSQYQTVLESIKSRDICSNRIQIIVDNSVELLQDLMNKKAETRPNHNLPQLRCSSQVQFTTLELVKSASYPITRSILRRSLKNDDKETIRNIIRNLRGEIDIDSSIDSIKKLVDDNISQSNIVHYLLRHSLLEQNQEGWYRILCIMISQSIEYIRPQRLETGIIKVVNELKEIQLDAPHAPRFMRQIVEEL